MAKAAKRLSKVARAMTHPEVMELLGAPPEEAERVRELLEEGQIRSHLPPPVHRHLEGIAARHPKEVVAPLLPQLVVGTEVDGRFVVLTGDAAIEDVAQGVESIHAVLEDVALEVQVVTNMRNGWCSVVCSFTGRVRNRKDRRLRDLLAEQGWKAGERRSVPRRAVFHVAGDWITKLGEEESIDRALATGAATGTPSVSWKV